MEKEEGSDGALGQTEPQLETKRWGEHPPGEPLGTKTLCPYSRLPFPGPTRHLPPAWGYFHSSPLPPGPWPVGSRHPWALPWLVPPRGWA